MAERYGTASVLTDREARVWFLKAVPDVDGDFHYHSTFEEIAKDIGKSKSTAYRDWIKARAKLRQAEIEFLNKMYL
jgi:hypothetical protein